MATDEQIKKNIERQLSWDTRIDSTNINVDVKDWTVILHGFAPSHLAKQAAEEDVWVIPGVVDVDNKLKISYPPSIVVPTDAEIKSSIENTLKWDPNIDEKKVKVSVSGGRATLEGSIDAYWKKTLTEDLSSNLIGVVGVDNKLAIMPTETIKDEEIAKNIIEAISRNVNANVNSINVEVGNGKVMLSGNVPSWVAHDAAYDAALFTAGVKDIEDNITVS